jgi:predicted N-acetyltransferase YhbS
MGAAHTLYERLGFKETPAYRFNPVPGARFMALELNDRPRAPPSRPGYHHDRPRSEPTKDFHG